ncbi:MAG: hypothetical protein LLF76_08720, partial [Planctomycetaceae bacterium]|nr:hypothetical protein [Planctomycetaceae bacterium]
ESVQAEAETIGRDGLVFAGSLANPFCKILNASSMKACKIIPDFISRINHKPTPNQLFNTHHKLSQGRL